MELLELHRLKENPIKDTIILKELKILKIHKDEMG